MITVKKLTDQDLSLGLDDPQFLELLSNSPEFACKPKNEYLGLPKETIYQLYANENIVVCECVYEGENRTYSEICLSTGTLGLLFNSFGICIQALLFDNYLDPEEVAVMPLANMTACIN